MAYVHEPGVTRGRFKDLPPHEALMMEAERARGVMRLSPAQEQRGAAIFCRNKECATPCRYLDMQFMHGRGWQRKLAFARILREAGWKSSEAALDKAILARGWYCPTCAAQQTIPLY